jgi:GNAT superfamily N-acetyltransferase
MQRKWFTRVNKDGDEEDIYELWKNVYPSEQRNRNDWMRWWNWMYKQSPNGSNIWLAEDNGKIVGQFTFIFNNLKVGNEVKTAAFSIDTMTHPDYRHQGVMATLARNGIDELAKASTYITYGFPNELAYPIDIKIGFFNIADLRSMIMILNWKNILSTRISNNFLLIPCTIIGKVLSKILFIATKVPEIKDLQISQVSQFDERINAFWARISGNIPIMIARSKSYLNWRYATVPNIIYTIYLAEKNQDICGYLVLRYRQINNMNVAVIYELFAEPEETAQCLINHAINNCKKDGMDYIHWSGIANKSYFKAFRKRGFFSPPFQTSQSRFVLFLSASDISKNLLLDPHNWLIQTGDSDIL